MQRQGLHLIERDEHRANERDLNPAGQAKLLTFNAVTFIRPY